MTLESAARLVLLAWFGLAAVLLAVACVVAGCSVAWRLLSSLARSLARR